MTKKKFNIPDTIKRAISGLVNGRRHVMVGHMMFATKENFLNVNPEEGLNLIRTLPEVKVWIEKGEIGTPEARMAETAAFTAHEIGKWVLNPFATARYAGD